MENSHNMQLVMAILFSFLNFIPLFSKTFYPTQADDYAVGQADSYLFQSFIAPIFISLIPGMDLILDIIQLNPIMMIKSQIIQVLDKDTSLQSSDSVYKETRLSIPERILFLLGVLCFSIVSFPSYINAPTDQTIFLYNAFLNTNTILIICPVLAFFSRCSTSFTYVQSLGCGLSICIGCVLSSLSAIWAPTTDTFKNIVIASSIFIDIAAAIYVHACAVALYTSYASIKDLSNNEDSLASQDIMFEKQFRTNVVAAHMLATGIVIVLNAVWYWYVQNLSSYILEICTYITIGSVAITYLIEFRVRKTEVSASLAALLDSKKSYVRYVSHELRTPIAVALMGVNIAKLDLHEIYKIPEDSAVTQTLMDVEVACSSAVDILNDMLSFDKLESGVMMVHKSMVRVEPFIASCVKLYSSQCRQKNIHLIIQYDIDKQLKKRGAISIVAEDEVECDKSKVEQVIRNLVANAIAYSSAGSTVTIRVFYLPPNSKRRFSLSSRSALASLSPGPGSGSGSGPGHRSQSPSVNSSFRNNNINGAHSPAPMNTELKEESVYSGESIFELDEDADQQNAVGGDVKKMLEGYGRLVIECVDHGVGISRKNQAKLFNGVVQFAAEKLQANGGTGYGMYISKGIAELHGGKLSVYSRGVGHGSTFTLRLPMLRSAEAQASENKLTDKPASIRMTDTNLGFTDCDAFSLKSIPAGSDIGSISTRTAMLSKQQSSTRTFEYYNTDDMVDQKLGTLMQMNEDSPRSSFKNTGSTMKLFSSLIGLSPDELHDSALDTNCTVELVVSDPGASIASTATDSNAALTGSAPGFASALRTMSSKSASVHSASSAESKQSEPSLPPPTYKLLAVDDSRVIRRLIIKTMVSKGHTCDEAEDGIDGVNKIKAQLESGGVTYDAILMDFVMPNMDGPTATKEIRDLGVTIPILGLTGNCLPRDVEWFMECGATAVMFKPLNVKEFDDHMNTYVNRK